jgi:hypothetical protein
MPTGSPDFFCYAGSPSELRVNKWSPHAVAFYVNSAPEVESFVHTAFMSGVENFPMQSNLYLRRRRTGSREVMKPFKIVCKIVHVLWPSICLNSAWSGVQSRRCLAFKDSP